MYDLATDTLLSSPEGKRSSATTLRSGSGDASVGDDMSTDSSPTGTEGTTGDQGWGMDPNG